MPPTQPASPWYSIEATGRYAIVGHRWVYILQIKIGVSVCYYQRIWTKKIELLLIIKSNNIIINCNNRVNTLQKLFYHHFQVVVGGDVSSLNQHILTLHYHHLTIIIINPRSSVYQIYSIPPIFLNLPTMQLMNATLSDVHLHPPSLLIMTTP